MRPGANRMASRPGRIGCHRRRARRKPASRGVPDGPTSGRLPRSSSRTRAGQDRAQTLPVPAPGSCVKAASSGEHRRPPAMAGSVFAGLDRLRRDLVDARRDHGRTDVPLRRGGARKGGAPAPRWPASSIRCRSHRTAASCRSIATTRCRVRSTGHCRPGLAGCSLRLPRSSALPSGAMASDAVHWLRTAHRSIGSWARRRNDPQVPARKKGLERPFCVDDSSMACVQVSRVCRICDSSDCWRYGRHRR